MDYKFHFTYRVNDVVKTAAGNNEDFDIDSKKTKNQLKVILIPKKNIEILNFYVERDYDYPYNSTFFANGFQSWTDTKEFKKDEKMPGIGLIGKSPYGKAMGFKYVGDYTFVNEETTPGEFHSHSLAYVRDEDKIDFFGSLNDKTGYTIIYADMNENTLRFSKDLEGIVIINPYEILDLYLLSGEYDHVFTKYFDKLGVKPITDEKITGYTSWYNYYQNINEQVILRDLGSICRKKEYINTFQIDDGYQTAVGDWLSVNSKRFPSGMKYIADCIHEKGFQAGLWLAPFGAQKTSKVAKEHPDWLIRNEKNKPICVGQNWGGFYALDIYNDEARQYIKDVFHEVLDVWGFDLVKLDFLYAAAIVPMHGKTRGEIAYDSIDLLRECVGDKKILGCGVQQMPCFGKVEYMRIGADMSLQWEHTSLRRKMHREDVSTSNAIHNSIYRRGFNGRAFLCDPDVFLLRRTNIGFSRKQQKLLAKFIKIFGNVLFVSDNIAEYDEEQMKIFENTLTDNANLVSVDEKNDIITVKYIEDGRNKTLKFTNSTGIII